MKAYFNGQIYTGTEILTNHAILVDNNKIIAVVEDDKIPSEYTKKDLKGNCISAGFIDIQLNGCGGALFNDTIDEKSLVTMHKSNLKFGCTNFLPTFITAIDEEIKKALAVCEDVMKKGNTGIIGMHLEGPYISKEKNGIHQKDIIRPLDEEMLQILESYGKKGVLKIITIAPENTKPEHITRLKKAGIIVSMGHTNATYEEAMNGVRAGVTMATHLFNAMSGSAGRSPGVVGCVMSDERVHAGIISDGFHVHWANVKIAKKVMGERLIITTDAAAPAGTEIEEFQFAGQQIFHKNGKLTNATGTLAGSALVMIDGVRNAIKHLNITRLEAIRMATLYPARALELENEMGQIKAGCNATFISFNHHMQLVDLPE